MILYSSATMQIHLSTQPHKSDDTSNMPIKYVTPVHLIKEKRKILYGCNILESSVRKEM